MKKFLILLVSAGLVLGPQSCKKKMKDVDVQSAVQTALAANPDFSGLSVTVNEGVASISGQVNDESARTAAQTVVAAVKGVKSVQNNTTVFTPAPVVPEPQGDALEKAISDAVKDYPGVTATLNDQVLVLTGEIPRANLQKLMMALSALKPMGLKSIDSKGLTKK